jgi:hypothetical protein
VVQIHVVNDFYEPLQAYGQWIDLPGYGHCWMPSGVDSSWRPYSDGHWQRTDAGWYWVSDERWGWATYHYGRWHRDDNSGWVWIPQTQWAPAWVAWREGGGYTGWAPLPPEARFEVDGTGRHQGENLDPHLFVFVEEKKMLEPQRHQNVIVNNTTIINNTINITKITVVNQTVINEGPRPESVAQATGHPVNTVAAKSLRTRLEAPAVAAKHKAAEGSAQPVVPKPFPPAHNQADVNETQPPRAEPEPGTISTEPRPSAGQEPSHQSENAERVEKAGQAKNAEKMEKAENRENVKKAGDEEKVEKADKLEKEERSPSPVQNIHPETKPNEGNLKSDQKLELEKKQAEEKAHPEKDKPHPEKPHSQSPTNSPAGPKYP